MTQKNLRLVTRAGIAIAVIGVIAAAIGYAMDDTYPETAPSWAIALIWTGAGVAALSALLRGFLSGLRG